MACCFFRRGFCFCRKKQSSSNRNQHSDSAPPAHGSTRPTTATAALVCHTCRRPIVPSDRHIHIQQQLSPRRYHIDCFVCLHCHAQINPQREEFCYSKLKNKKKRRRARQSSSRADGGNTNTDEADNPTTDTPSRHNVHRQLVNDSSFDIQTEEDDDEHPFHRACFAHRFGWLCVVCEQPLPMATKLIEDSSSPGDTDTASINEASGNRNSFDNDRIMVDNSDSLDHDTLIVSNRNIKWRRTTKVEFLKHPFFSNERMCRYHVETTASSSDTMMMQQQQGHQQVGIEYIYHSTGGGDGEGEDNFISTEGSSTIDAAAPTAGGGGGHGRDGERRSIRRCAGCHRFEPALASPAKHFVNVGDPNSEQCLCLACCRTVVTSSDDVVPLWDRVIDFFDGPLGLITSEDSCISTTNKDGRRIKGGVTRQDLKNIPIMMVGLEALNDNMKELRNYHFGSNHILTRGLCLSEHDNVAHLDCVGGGGVGVTAILCLSGLPSDLTASILAHEATHAYIKLHPNFSHANPLPLEVEEGIAQLIAHLFLGDGVDPNAKQQHSSEYGQNQQHDVLDDEEVSEDENDIDEGGGTGDDSIPSDEKLRQYFRFCIETDDGVYGEGFRLAARAYAKMGIQELLYHVALHHSFPTS